MQNTLIYALKSFQTPEFTAELSPEEERLTNSKFKEPFLMDLDTKRFMFSIQRIMKSSVSELGFTSQIEREKYSRFLFVTKSHALDH